jgi:hypothetical protein
VAVLAGVWGVYRVETTSLTHGIDAEARRGVEHVRSSLEEK